MVSNSAISISFRITDDANGFKTLTADADAFRKIMAETVNVANQMQDKVFKAASTATVYKSAAEAVNQLNSAFQAVTSESLNFGNAMKAANTMAGKDSEGFNKLKGQVAGLAKEVPIARDLLANGLYQVISNGVPENNWIEFLRISARSAVGGIADINKVVGVTSTIIKNYGLEWSAAADIQDKIQLTAKNGVTSFEQLAQALPRVTGNAATLGVSIDELMGTFATLTGVSGNTAEVSTQLAAIFTSLVKPTSDAAKLAEEMGIQFDAAAIKASGGFQYFLSNLDRTVKSYAQATGVLEQEIYGRLFGSAEALRALIPLQGELSEKFSLNIAAMVDSTGTMDAAFEEMSGTSESVAQKIKNQWATVTDAIASVTSGIQPYLDFIAGIANTGSSLVILTNAFKSLNGQISLMPLFSKKAQLGLQMLEIAGGKSAKAMGMLKIALGGILKMSGVVAVLWGLYAIFDHFTSSTDKAVGSMKEAQKAASDWRKSLTDLSGAVESATTKEISALERLYTAATDELKSREERIRAVNEIQSIYPEVFGNLETEAILAGQAACSYENLKNSLVEVAKARAAASKIERNQGEWVDLDIEKQQLKEASEARKKEIERLEKEIPDALNEANKRNLSALVSPTNKRVVEDAREANVAYNNAKARLESLKADEDAAQNRLKVIEDSQREIVKANNQLSQYSLSKPKKEIGLMEMTLSQVKAAIIETNKALDDTNDPQKISKLKAYNAQLEARKKVLEAMRGRGGGSEKQKFDTSMGYENFTMLGQYEQYLSELSKKRMYAHGEELHALDELISKVKEAMRAFENGFKVDDSIRNFDKDGRIVDSGKLPSIKLPKLATKADITPKVDISKVKEYFDEMERQAEEAAQSMKDSLMNGWNGIKGIGSGIDGITEAINGNGSAWERVTGIVDGTIAIFQGVQAAMQMVTALSAPFRAAKKAEGAAAKESASSSFLDAIAKLFEAHSWMPFVGIGIAGAMVGAMLATMLSAPKFAKGGIAYGPTLGIFGEYAGAANNPEVVAPLDKLRSLIQPAEGIGGDVRFRIAGADLEGVLIRRTNFRNRI